MSSEALHFENKIKNLLFNKKEDYIRTLVVASLLCGRNKSGNVYSRWNKTDFSNYVFVIFHVSLALKLTYCKSITAVQMRIVYPQT
jgi:hypothetical protein